AALYFLIDAVFLSAVRAIIRPLVRALARLRISTLWRRVLANSDSSMQRLESGRPPSLTHTELDCPAARTRRKLHCQIPRDPIPYALATVNLNVIAIRNQMW